MPHPVHFGLPLLVLVGFVLPGCSHPKPIAAPPTTQAAVVTQPAAAPPPNVPPHFTAPDHVCGIYLTAWSASSTHKMTAVYDMLAHTSINSVVIDIRDTGEMYWKTGIELAKTVKANQNAINHPEKLMADLASHGVYPIARIACFRDSFVPKKFPTRGVMTASGGVWRDHSGHSWLDPYNKDNWDYIAATVDYALDIGFPEIQLDYVRFPSEGKSRTQRFPGQKKYPDAKAKPEDVIASFADFISQRVRARHAVVSADIFGIISSTKGDEGIGQELEKVAKPFDVISPMVYPSHFAAGEYGIKYPVAEPYQILSKSLADYKKRLPKTAIRPWLQDFSLREPGQPLVHYGVTEIQAEIKAAHDSGYDDFLMWNAANRYTDA